ncbi:MAG: hypothetical protein HYY43_02490, partial [Deltaproteobacteria bacterium]|nr:hypothetical protein [Deltaproteobacteria bacterium]
MAIGNTSGLPHVPAYRTIEPKEYSFFDFSHIIEENYLKDGLMDLDKLKTDLSFSLNKDMPSEERRLVTDILRTVREASQLHGMTPKTVSEFRELICEKSFFKLKVLLHLREEEFYFNQFLSTVMFEGDFDFEALRTRIERFGVLPENAASFKEQLGPHFYERFERLFMAAATSGIYEGRSEESVKLLANLIAYDDTHFIYGISKSFAPSINNPDYFPICEDIKLPKDSRWLMRTAEGYRFFCGLREFLKADVSNEHKVGELLLDDVRKTGTYEINLPPAIDIKEGETVVFEGVFKTNVVGLEYDIKMDVEVPKGAEDRFFAKYDPEENKLTLTAARNYDNHEQYRIKVKMHAEITNLDGQFPAFEPNLDATREFSVFNDNEPPRLLAKAPKHVREGQLFCMDAKVIDPEGDPVNIEWYQIDGLEGKSVIHEGGVRACLQADATHQIEKPYQFRVVAKDVINSVQHPEILAKSTDDYLLVYNLPRMRVAGDEVELPLDVIEALTNPDGPQMAAIAYATSTHLLTFLRMPDELKYYGNRLKANHVANVINVTGCDGSIGKRSWSACDDVPSSEGVYAYVATSPVRPWIKPGVYPFNGAAIYLEHMQKPIRAKIPIKGAANIKDSARTMLLSIEDPERVSDAIIRIPFRVKNVIYDKEQMLQLPDELPVTLNVKGSSRAGVVDMERKMTAVLQERDGMDAAYAIDIPLPPEYTPRTNSLLFEVEVKDRENEMAQLYAKKRFVSKGSSLFDSINLSTPTYLMPFPWVMVYIDVDKGLEQFVPVIAGAKH